MENANQSFRKSLEQYVFGVANKFIESAGQATQSELINLITQLDPVVDPSKDAAGESAEPESEWQRILNKPVD